MPNVHSINAAVHTHTHTYKHTHTHTRAAHRPAGRSRYVSLELGWGPQSDQPPTTDEDTYAANQPPREARESTGERGDGLAGDCGRILPARVGGGAYIKCIGMQDVEWCVLTGGAGVGGAGVGGDDGLEQAQAEHGRADAAEGRGAADADGISCSLVCVCSCVRVSVCVCVQTYLFGCVHTQTHLYMYKWQASHYTGRMFEDDVGEGDRVLISMRAWLCSPAPGVAGATPAASESTTAGANDVNRETIQELADQVTALEEENGKLQASLDKLRKQQAAREAASALESIPSAAAV